jgi:uncharacterized protein YjaZ
MRVSIFLLLLLASCSSQHAVDKEEKETIPAQTEVSFSHNEQNFKIIPFYEEVLAYTGYVKDNPSKSNPGAYVEKVLEPIKKKSEMNYLSLDYPFSSSTDVERFEDTTMKLLQNEKKINELIKDALIKSSEILPGGDTNIYVMPLRPEDQFVIENMKGVAGVTYNKDAIFIQIDTSFTEEMLQYIVAHEYHHTINMQTNGDSGFYSVLDKMISEGKADSFARIVYPDINAPWTEPLLVESEKKVFEELKENADSMSMKIYMDFFNGNSAKGIPLWSNYKIGYQVTQSYLEMNPNVSIVDWTRLRSKDMLQASEYNQLLK